MRRITARTALVLVIVIAGCDEQNPTGPSAAVTTSGSGSGAATVSATRYLAFGASMTAGEVTGAVSASGTLGPLNVVASASYPAQLQQRLRSRYPAQSSQLTVTNAGQSGELAIRAEARLSQLLANTPTDALLLFDGHNDLLDFGAGGVGPASAAMDRMAKEARQRGARVFIALLPPPIAGRQRSVPDEVVRAFNDQLRTIAAGEGAVLVDLYRALSSDVNRYIGADGHHPTEAGYQRIADEFLARIGDALQR